MTGFSAGSAYVDLIPRLEKGWSNKISRDVEGSLSGIGKKAGKIGLVAGAGIVAGVGAASVALVGIGKAFDSAYDRIEIGTGKTGKALEGLKADFRSVAADSPDSLNQVAEAITTLNQRTGLSGKPLQDLAKQVTTLARVTGEDLGTILENSTRTFGDWGIAAEEQGPKLDYLFKVGQQTGVAVSTLEEKLVRFGAPLRQLGFSFEESAALIGKFQKEGVNTDLVMGSLRIALGKLSKGSEESKTEIQGLSDGFQSAKEKSSSMRDALDSSRDNVRNLTESFADAKKALDDALTPPSADDLEGAQLRIERGILGQQDATDRLAEAQKAVAEARKAGDPKKVAAAERDLAKAKLDSKEAALSSREAEKHLQDLRKKGTEQDDAVIGARRRLRDVSEQLRDANENEAKAVADLTAAQAIQAQKGNELATAIDLANTKAGDAPKVLRDYMNRIKDAGTVAEANSLAMEIFGAKAGPDMAAAIREGRFSVDEMVSTIKASDSTIVGTAAKTDDFAEKFAKLKNKIMIAVEPLAGRFFDAMTSVAAAAAPVAAWIGERLPGAFESLSRIVSPIIAGVKQSFGVLFSGDFQGEGPLSEDSPFVRNLFIFRDFVIDSLIPAGEKFIGWLSRNWKPVLVAAGAALLLVVGPVTLVVGALIAAWARFKWFRTAVNGVAVWLTKVVPPAFEKVRAAAMSAFGWISRNVLPVMKSIVGFIAKHWKPILAAAGAALLLITGPVAVVIAGLIAAYAKFGWFRDGVKAVIGAVVSVVSSLVAWWKEIWPSLSEAVGHVWSVISKVVKFEIAFMSKIIRTGVGIIVAIWDKFGKNILESISIVWDAIKLAVGTAIRIVKDIIKVVLDVINGDWGKAWSALKDGFGAVWDGIIGAVSLAGRLLKNAISAIMTGIGWIWATAWNNLKKFVGGLWDGIFDGLKGALNLMLGVLESGVNLAVAIINKAIDGLNIINPFDDIPHVPDIHIPRIGSDKKPKAQEVVSTSKPPAREKGGPIRPGKDYIVGDRGNDLSHAEILHTGGMSGRVFPHRTLEDLIGAALGANGDRGSVMVPISIDARGIQEPAVLADLTSRHVAWRLATKGSK